MTGLRHQINRPAETVGAEAQGVRPFVDLDILGGQEFQRLEIAEAIGVTVGKPIDQHIHAAQMEIVAQARAED